MTYKQVITQWLELCEKAKTCPKARTAMEHVIKVHANQPKR